MRSLELSKILMLLTALVVASCGQSDGISPQEDTSYYGTVANEAEYSFKAYTLMPLSAGVPSENAISIRIKTILKFIMGHMDDDGSVSYKFEHKVKKIEQSNDGYKVTYELKGRGIFRTKFKDYVFIVPIAPDELYSVAKGKCQKTSEGGESSYWYDWKVDTLGCLLVEGKHYSKVKASLKIIKATKETYPEYEKLVVNDQLTATMYFGAADHNNKNWDPLTSTEDFAEWEINFNEERDDPFGSRFNKVQYKNSDAGAAGYRQTRDFLIGLGFTARRYDEKELRQIYNPKLASKLPFAEELIKRGANGKTMKVRLLFLETQASVEDSEGFHRFYMNSLKNDGVIFYNGHSGLGKNLSLDIIDSRYGSSVVLNPNYQIIHFGSCIPYAYYADMYFTRKINQNDKNGTKNLDIFAYGKESHFKATEDQKFLSALDKYVFTGVKTSYQNIITATPVDLFGVLGDEDNN